MDEVFNIEKLSQFNLLKKDIEEVWWQIQSLNSRKRRLVHLTEVLKDPCHVCESIITLLSLNVSIEDTTPR